MNDAPESGEKGLENVARNITRKSGSNLALAFFWLPRDQRRDMETFYAFCREVDDIADDVGRSVEQRRAQLDNWKVALADVRSDGYSALVPAVRSLILRRAIPVGLLEDILAGMEKDLCGVRHQTFGELETYCYHVAGAVGLASLRIFGADPERCDAYARKLGLGLQLTNILRDIGEDFRGANRIYVPADEMARFGVREEAFAPGDGGGREGGGDLRGLLEFQADRAHRTLEEAHALLPAQDRRALKAPELMRAMYAALLGEMRSDGLRVLDKRYRLRRSQKLRVLLLGR